MINNFVHVRKFQPSEFEELKAKAATDAHGVFNPTHVVERGEKTLGYLCVGSPGVPFVLGWLSTMETTPRDSFTVVNFIENLVQLGGAFGVAFPIPKASAFYENMEKLGYKSAGEYTLFVKEL